MKIVNDKTLSILLLIFYSISVLCIVFPFMIYKDAYVRLSTPIRFTFFAGAILAGLSMAYIAFTWKGLTIVRYELFAFSFWCCLLGLWFGLKIEAGLPLFLIGIMVLAALVYSVIKGLPDRKKSPKNRDIL